MYFTDQHRKSNRCPLFRKGKISSGLFSKGMYVVWAQSILAGSQQFLHVRAVLLQYPLAPGAFLLPLGDRNPTCWASRISLYQTTGLPSIVYELQPWVVLMKNHTNLGRLFHLLIIQLSLLPLLNFLIGLWFIIYTTVAIICYVPCIELVLTFVSYY